MAWARRSCSSPRTARSLGDVRSTASKPASREDDRSSSASSDRSRRGSAPGCRIAGRWSPAHSPGWRAARPATRLRRAAAKLGPPSREREESLAGQHQRRRPSREAGDPSEAERAARGRCGNPQPTGLSSRTSRRMAPPPGLDRCSHVGVRSERVPTRSAALIVRCQTLLYHGLHFRDGKQVRAATDFPTRSKHRIC